MYIVEITELYTLYIYCIYFLCSMFLSAAVYKTACFHPCKILLSWLSILWIFSTKRIDFSKQSLEGYSSRSPALSSHLESAYCTYICNIHICSMMICRIVREWYLWEQKRESGGRRRWQCATSFGSVSEETMLASWALWLNLRMYCCTEFLCQCME